MKNTVWKGICQTLILMLALFLLSISFLQMSFTPIGEMLEKAEDPNAFVQELKNGDAEIPSGAPESPLPESAADAGDGHTPSLRERVKMKVIDNPRFSGLFYAGLFLLIALFLILDAMPLRERTVRARRVILINAGLSLGCGIPFLIGGYTTAAVVVMNVLYIAIRIGEATIKLRENHRPGHIVFWAVLFALLAANLYLFPKLPIFVLFLISLRSLVEILRISFSQIRLDIVRKIIRKTYASEILLGLLLLMVAFSLVLSLLDSGMNSFWDALWFCFATVTTIGYGDVTTTTALGRILSVILGLYGIVVVALITSIIVNLYNEMKSDSPEE